MWDTLDCDATNALANFSDGIRPKRLVKELADMDKWMRSVAFARVVNFINEIGSCIQGKKMTDNVYISPFMLQLLDVLKDLDKLIDETPPSNAAAQENGCIEYRTWSRKMYNDVIGLLVDIVPQEKCQIITELSYYLNESFGNAIRIEYGTGHELSFIFFLCGLYEADLLYEEDNLAVAFRLFNSYLSLCQRLQQTYKLGAAGSLGVWSLDDFFFIPYIWGSAQLCNRAPFIPLCYLDKNIIKEYKDDYMLISVVDYITKRKVGHFAEHSNQLWALLAVPTWLQIYRGLMRMYKKQVLLKFPVLQNCYFGELMRFEFLPAGTVVQLVNLISFSQTKKMELDNAQLAAQAAAYSNQNERAETSDDFDAPFVPTSSSSSDDDPY